MTVSLMRRIEYNRDANIRMRVAFFPQGIGENFDIPITSQSAGIVEIPILDTVESVSAGRAAPVDHPADTAPVASDEDTLADSEAIYRNPKHAYTKALLSAVPIADPKVKRKKILLEGDVPSPIDPPEGSAFGHRLNHPRYDETIGMDLSLKEIEPGHLVAADPCCLEPEDWKRLS